MNQFTECFSRRFSIRSHVICPLHALKENPLQKSLKRYDARSTCHYHLSLLTRNRTLSGIVHLQESGQNYLLKSPRRSVKNTDAH
jgi:hypothetical protein